MAYNATVNQTTGYSPFFVIHGRHCRLPFDSVVGSRATEKSLPDWVRDHLEKLGVVYDAVASKLKLNALHRKRAFDLKRDVTLSFRPGDRVLLLKGSVVDKTITKHEFATQGPYLGPFTIERVLERDNYLLCDMQTRRMHNKVHVERLVPYPMTSARETESGSEYYSVRSIVGRRVAPLAQTDRHLGIGKGTPTLQYRVRWTGFSSASDTWLHPSYLGSVKELVDAFDKRSGGTVETLPGISREAAIDLQTDEAARQRPTFRGRSLRAEAKDEAPSLPNAPAAPSAAHPEVTRVRRSPRLAMLAACGCGNQHSVVARPEFVSFVACVQKWLFEPRATL